MYEVIKKSSSRNAFVQFIAKGAIAAACGVERHLEDVLWKRKVNGKNLHEEIKVYSQPSSKDSVCTQ